MTGGVERGLSPAPGVAARSATTLATVLPGLALALAIAAGARAGGRIVPGLPEVVAALAAGVLARNLLDVGWSLPGARFAVRYVLRLAIILVGGSLTVATVASRGAAVLALVVGLFLLALGMGVLVARTTRLSPAMGILVGAGTAICGASAILTISPLVAARDEETAYAIGTIFTFNLLALALFPLIGHLLLLNQVAFGTWAGTAVNDTSVVIATGFSYGPAAGAVATVTKLVRTLLLLPLAIAIGAFMFRRGARGSTLLRSVRHSVPWFIAGFVAMAAIHSAGVLPPELFTVTSTVASFLVVVVLAAVGLGVEVRSLVAQGVRPLLTGLLLGTAMAAASLVAVSVLRVA